MNYECEIEKYIVYYGESKQTFNEPNTAIEFGRKKMDEGFDVTIKQIEILTGWY